MVPFLPHDYCLRVYIYPASADILYPDTVVLPPEVLEAKSSKLFSLDVSNSAVNSSCAVLLLDTNGPLATAGTPGVAAV
jgi:hypothetical protein